MAEQDELTYRLNRQDEIISVNEAWDRFALANDAPELAAGRVLGRSLWEFIADVNTQQVYRDLLARVRTGRSVRFPFRCDAPYERRFLEMQIRPLEDGQVEFRTKTLAIERRPAVALLERPTGAAEGLLRMCSWCKKVYADGAWVEVEEGIARLRLFERPVVPMITHGMCDHCAAKMAEILAAM